MAERGTSEPNGERPRRLVLASASPRRAELLSRLGVAYEVSVPEVDESPLAGERPADYVSRLARTKAAAVQGSVAPGRALLAADTTVSLDDRLFGKPADEQDAVRMLTALAGRWHDVHTGVALAVPGRDVLVVVAAARVEFTPLSREAIAAYWRSGEPRDKAGAYGIQGLGGAFVSRLEGSYSAVVGLPLAETRALLDATGIPHALGEGSRAAR